MNKRMVWKYEAKLVEMRELKKGDFYQVQKAAPEDPIDEATLWQACEDAKQIDPAQNKGADTEIMSCPMIHDPNVLLLPPIPEVPEAARNSPA